jgi:hypothetical protein
MHKEARLNNLTTNEMLTKTVQTGHPKDRVGIAHPSCANNPSEVDPKHVMPRPLIKRD